MSAGDAAGLPESSTASGLVDRADAAGRHVVVMREVVKRFGSVCANDHVDFDLAPGEIHALLGENGAGKTTLMNMLFGLFRPDSGDIVIGGEGVELRSPRDALERGVGMVHQHFMLVPKFTVAENVAVGSRSAWNMRLHRSEIERDVERVVEQYGLRVDPSDVVGDLSIDVQQRVEIVKLLYRGARVLILDEPTAVLGPAEIDQLFSILRQLREHGNAVVIITHKLSEVMRVADRVTVLRHGKRVSHAVRGEFDEGTLAEAMIGHALPQRPKRRAGAEGSEPTVRVTGLSVAGDRHADAVMDVSFVIQPGEILGVAGVEGNGQTELCQALSGLRAPTSGSIEVGGTPLKGGDLREFYARGVSVITEDRLRWDLIADLSLAENLALSAVRAGAYSQWGFLRRRSLRRHAGRLLNEYDVRPPDPDMPASGLSGGNQQKVVVARECSRNPRVLIASQPTRGLDVSATQFVYQRLNELRDAGCAILLNSVDLDELLALADRILVLFRGRAVLERAASEVSVSELAQAMAGSSLASAQEVSNER